MKKYLIIMIAIVMGISCNRERNKPHTEDESHSESENIVTLNPKQVDALNLKLGTFEIKPMTIVVRTNGELEVSPSGSADVTAVIGGNVKEILVFHGDRVKKGQSMVVLEHPDYIALQQEFAEVSSNLEYLEKEFNRQEELSNSNVNAEKNFQLAQSEYKSAKARFQGLKSRLELININPGNVLDGNISREIYIVSPINGFVNDVKIKIGTYIEPKDVLFSVSNNNEIHADFMVYEKDIHHIRQGQKVNFTVANRPGEELTATIFAIGKEFEPNLRAVHIHARLDKNPGNLIPGMYISGHIHSEAGMSKTLPEDAVVSDGTKSFIFVLDKVEESAKEETENHENEEHSVMSFRMIEVVTGLTDEGFIEVDVVDSISENAQIVLNAAYYLLADMKKDETEHIH
jgi:cobalt-zinc-cadmium efflux system membrane fusion protein